MILSIGQVRKYVINHLDRLEGGYLHVSEDMFWDIDADDKFNMDKEPEILVGSLIDDIDHLNELISEDIEITGAVELQKLANLLCLLSRHCSNIRFDKELR